MYNFPMYSPTIPKTSNWNPPIKNMGNSVDAQPGTRDLEYNFIYSTHRTPIIDKKHRIKPTKEAKLNGI